MPQMRATLRRARERSDGNERGDAVSGGEYIKRREERALLAYNEIDKYTERSRIIDQVALP